MSKLIKTWKYKDQLGKKTIKLFDNFIAEIFIEDSFNYEEKYSFDEIFKHKLMLTSEKLDYEIFKNIVKLPKPDNLSDLSNKMWDFWKNIDNNSINKEILKIKDKNLLKNKYGLAEIVKLYSDDERILNGQRIDKFFFFGPKMPQIPLSERIKLKNEIFNCLKNSNLKLNDGFVIFDYNKIKKIKFEKIEGISGDYFKIEEGKVIVGGWQNPRQGGEKYLSVEHLWYYTKDRVPKIFHDKIPFIIEELEKGFVK